MAAFLDPTLTPYFAAFLFVFAIVFGLLSVSKLMDKRVNAIIAVAFGLFAVLYEPFVTGLQVFLPIATIFLIIVFFIVFLKKVFGEKKEKSDTLPIAVTLAVLLGAMSVLGDELALLLPIGIEPIMFVWLSGLVIIILIFAAVWSRKEGAQ